MRVTAAPLQAKESSSWTTFFLDQQAVVKMFSTEQLRFNPPDRIEFKNGVLFCGWNILYIDKKGISVNDGLRIEDLCFESSSVILQIGGERLPGTIFHYAKEASDFAIHRRRELIEILNCAKDAGDLDAVAFYEDVIRKTDGMSAWRVR